MIFRGRVWKFGDNINTDVIIPGKYLRTTDVSVFAEHAMEGIDPSFLPQKGDIIVAGKNFGCGSSREQAVLALKFSNIGCVVAKSFGRIFFRNAINLGLPILEANVVDYVRQGDVIEVDFSEGIIKIDRKIIKGSKLPPFLQKILSDGGLIEHRKKTVGH